MYDPETKATLLTRRYGPVMNAARSVAHPAGWYRWARRAGQSLYAHEQHASTKNPRETPDVA
jgi:hypothetical protein